MDTCSSTFTAALLTIAKIQKQPKYPSVGNGYKSCEMRERERMSFSREKEDLVICDNLYEPKGHCASEMCQAEKEKYCVTSVCGTKFF